MGSRLPTPGVSHDPHYPSLVGVEFQPEFGKPAGDHVPQVAGLALAYAVENDIIGKAFERNVRVFPYHPRVEAVMQEQVRQQRGDRAA
jgi:hypothetical protein